MLEPWFIYAVVSAVSATIFAIIVRVLLKDKGDPIAFAILVDIAALVTLLIVSPFGVIEYAIDPKILLVLILFSFYIALMDVVFIKARKFNEVSDFSIGLQSSVIWVLILGGLFFGESLTLGKILGGTLIVLGNILASFKKKGFRISTGIKYVFLAAFLYASGSFVSKYLLTFFSPIAFQLILFFLAPIWILLYTPNRFERVYKELKLQGYRVFLAGIFFSIMLFFMVKGFDVGEASKVLPVQQASLIFTVLAGMIFLKERDRVWQKLAATAVVFTGAMFMRAS